MASVNDDTWKHGATLAMTFGCGLNFTSAEVTTGSSFSDEEYSYIAVYPTRYHGMGGGMVRATMDEMPVFEFDLEDAEQAEDLVAALNHFSLEGRIQ